MTTIAEESAVVWRERLSVWVLWAISALLLGLIFYQGLQNMVEAWARDEYSHGYLLPFIALFFVWQKKDALGAQPLTGSWLGLPIILCGILGFIFGELSSIYILVQYSCLLTLLGIMLAFIGVRGVRLIWPAFVLLLFTIPLPQFFYIALSSELQLISSKIGVAVIRAFDISVYLEGNVIDLGTMQLQVIEACSGLRYLFPLMALGFIAAYLFKAELWKRVVLFLSTMPITVFMNSARIGLIGITVEYWGKDAAEGFLHDFEGWVVFMGCTVVLVIEMWLLLKIGKHRQSLRDAFYLEFPSVNKHANFKLRKLPAQVVPAMALLVLAAMLSMFLPHREEIQPERARFDSFPRSIGGWQGESEPLEKIYVDVLKFEDYLQVNYQNPDHGAVNFYVTYYGSQRKGESAHSPRTCLPGGGWQFKQFSQKTIDSVRVNDKPLQVNRVLIQNGENQQLVYYWFQQRGRDITNEYLVKWYLFWDSLTRQRTDGALVRLTTPVISGDAVATADARLERFAVAAIPLLHNYVPD